MTAATMQITDLITAGGQTGPQMSHALKVLGDGDMQQGLIRIAKYFLAEGKSYINVGRVQGFIGGATSVGLIFLIAKLIMNEREKSEQKEETKAIMDAFKDYIPPKERIEIETHEDSVLPNNNIQPATEA